MLTEWKSLQMTISNLMEIVKSFLKGWKTLWEKDKLCVRSNFSLYHSVFKRLVLQTCRNKGLFGKGLRGKETVKKMNYNWIPDIEDLSSVNCWDKIILNKSLKMLFSEPLASLITFFKIILSQQSSNVRFFLSHNWLKRIKLKNNGPKHTHLAM